MTTRIMLMTDVDDATAVRLREPGQSWKLGGGLVIVTAAPDSAVFAAATDALPRWLNHLGGQAPGSDHALYWLTVAADVAHRGGQ